MLSFIKAQPAMVEKFLRHIETPAFVDLLIRIIQLDEHPEGTGVLEVRNQPPALQGHVLTHNYQHSGFRAKISWGG
jgi:hypothetical protein